MEEGREEEVVGLVKVAGEVGVVQVVGKLSGVSEIWREKRCGSERKGQAVTCL